MKVLIVEDDHTSRVLLQNMLLPYGEVHLAVDGTEALTQAQEAINAARLYDLICLDIMMPGKDGQTVLKEIREMEKEAGIWGSSETKVLMTTALGDPRNVVDAYYRGGATAYLVKPIDKARVFEELKKFGLLEP